MADITKADWKLFRERIGDWQEAHMEKLNKEYVELLSGNGPASKKFWNLKERIDKDRRTPGVQLTLEKSELDWDLVRLMKDGVITAEDLKGFSEELKKYVLERTGYQFDKDK